MGNLGCFARKAARALILEMSEKEKRGQAKSIHLGYTQPVGEHLKCVAFASDRPIACLAWGSGPWYIGARDRVIGWRKETREKIFISSPITCDS